MIEEMGYDEAVKQASRVGEVSANLERLAKNLTVAEERLGHLRERLEPVRLVRADLRGPDSDPTPTVVRSPLANHLGELNQRVCLLSETILDTLDAVDL